MQVREIHALRGPNYWSIKRKKLLQLTLDLEDLEAKPTDALPGFPERLQQLLPSLHEHRCSPGRPGGFFERVRRGTWIGHVIEHVALELQCLAGIEVSFGQTRGTGTPGVYHVVFEFGEEAAGRYAATAAVRLVDALIRNEHQEVQGEVAEIRRLWIREKPGPSTASLIQEAQSRHIPVLRLDSDSLVQLGYGCKQKRIDATITTHTSMLAVDIACDKDKTKQLLAAAWLPVPAGTVVSSEAELQTAVSTYGFPLVIKPANGNHGRGATIEIVDEEQARRAFLRAKKYGERLIVEKFIQGNDYRVLVINGRFVAAALRTPASITGDGRQTIRALIEAENQNPRRGEGHENVRTKIVADDVTREWLQKKGYTLQSILPPGQVLRLKPTANLSTGGTAIDVTDEVHPQNIPVFERIARTIGLDVCGIDIIAPGLSTPLKENGGAVLEVNAAPGFRMHLEPDGGKPRNVAKPVLDMLFPPKEQGRIPIVAITGTNGKTTTTRLLAHIVKKAGLRVGYCTTEGVYLQDERVLKGDCSGPASAEMILKDSTVEFAVLETARGGILRAGLGFDQCDAAIITNVAEDHLGLGGIDSLEKLARVKAVVAEAVQPNGYAILNADDDRVFAIRENLVCKVALFSLYADSQRIEAHCNAGGLASVYENGYLLLRIGRHYIPIEETANVPLTFGGRADFNIANVLATVLAAYTAKIKLGTIREALRSFTPCSENLPGRINLFAFDNFTVLLDYAHNPHGLRALGRFIKNVDAAVKIGLITGVGDRRNEDLVAMGREAALIFDEIALRHDADLRGRTREELYDLLTRGIRQVNPLLPVSYHGPECEALESLLKQPKANALLVVLAEDIEAVAAVLEHCQQQGLASLPQQQKSI